MNYKCFTFALSMLTVAFSLAAMTNCPAPAPTHGEVLEEGGDFISIEWDAVPGANSYEVTTVDAITGTSLTSTETSHNTHTNNFLEAGGEYLFEIRASYCTEGPYGPPLVMQVKTTIIIVDVILQMECLDDDLILLQSGTVAAGGHTTLEIPPEENGCFLIDATTLNLNPNIDLSMVVNANELGGLTLSNFLSNDDRFQLLGNGPVKGILSDPNDNRNINIMKLTARKKKGGNITSDFTWQQDMNITVSYCSNCAFTKPGELRANTNVVEQARNIKIHPNPVNSLLQLQIPVKGQIEIWDFTGRSWYASSVIRNEENLSVDTSNWPAGTYILRWYNGQDSPPELKYFLKL